MTLWHIILEHAPDAIIAVDGGGQVAAFNRAAEALFSLTAADVLGKQADAILDDGSALSRCFTAARISGHGQRCHLHHPASGAPMTVESTVTDIDLGKDGAGRLWIGVFRDITGRSDLEDALMETEERLAGITANLPGIVFQRVLQRDGSIYYPSFTPGTRAVLGFDPEEMRVTAEGCLDVIHWADRDAHLAGIRLSAQMLEPCHEEFRAITRAGEVRWLRGTSRPQRLPEGEVLWDGVLIDVTDRKRIEQRLEMIMDHAADAIITINETGVIDSANAAAERLFDYGMGELAGKEMASLMPEPYRSHYEAGLQAYLETGQGAFLGEGGLELVGLRKDETTFPFELSTSEVRLEGRRLFISIGRDITARKETEAALRESESRLRNMASNLPGIVFQRVMKPDGSTNYAYVSDGCRDVLGLEAKELQADSTVFQQLLAPDDRERFVRNLLISARNLAPMDEELRIITRDGDRRWVRGQSRPRMVENGDVVWDGVILDVTDRKRAEEKLLFLAYYDPLTGVPNRALFLDRFNTVRDRRMKDGAAKERAGAGGGDEKMIAVLSLGIDRFSIINTTLGHAIGDQVLTAAAQRLQLGLSEGDTLARASGDRFLLLLTNLPDDREVLHAVEKIQARLQVPLLVGGDEFDLSVCIGVSLFPRDGNDAETLVKNADAALYRAKSQGPGSVQIYTEEMNSGAAKTLTLQNRLRRAIEHSEFVSFYQPQVDLRTGKIVGMEALVRWFSPEGGMISPVEFIPVAEEYGLIDGICEQMLRQSCRQVKIWHDAGIASVPVAVNISGRQFQHSRRLIQTLEQVLTETGIAPRLLELELTESSAMRDPDNAIAVVQMLKEEMGIACAIDDFGTGYSSLSVLKRFPIKKLKIDRSFVADIITDANDAAIVNAIIAMAHALRLQVVAEGVETIEHLEFLRDRGCDQLQGYYFSRPLPAKDMEKLFLEGRCLPAMAEKTLETEVG